MRLCAFNNRVLYRGYCEIATRLRFYMTIIHFHIDNSHKFNLCRQLLYLFLYVAEIGKCENSIDKYGDNST